MAAVFTHFFDHLSNFFSSPAMGARFQRFSMRQRLLSGCRRGKWGVPFREQESRFYCPKNVRTFERIVPAACARMRDGACPQIVGPVISPFAYADYGTARLRGCEESRLHGLACHAHRPLRMWFRKSARFGLLHESATASASVTAANTLKHRYFFRQFRPTCYRG